ncbi:MAG: transglycosylase SLT domain-containing protein [Bacteroidales bacterium]|nr:transglycosylase SLT domain-containing protein [Bacteroidales bacterium]
MPHILATIAFLLLLCLQPALADSLDEQRERYQRATAALARGDDADFQRLKAQLQDYPLHPYLEYAEYSIRLERTPAETIRRFIGANGDSPLAGRLRSQWLDHLRQQRRDDDFITFYEDAGATVEQRCHYLLLRYRAGDRNSAVASGLQLWQEGRSQPNACDPLFEHLIEGGHISNPVAFKRFVAAVLNHDYRLANYVARFFTSDRYRNLANTLMAADRQPASLGDHNLFDDPLFRDHSAEVLDVIAHGLTHLATSDAPRALGYWNRYHQSHTFSPEAESRVVNALVRQLFQQGHTLAADTLLRASVTLVPPATLDWRLQQAIRAGLWSSVLEWSEHLPDTLADSGRWRYWRARALELTGQGEQRRAEIDATYHQLATERSFYGFLASEKIGAPPAMQHTPVPVTDSEVEVLAATPAFRRIAELYHHGDLVPARREWIFQLRDEPGQTWLAAARLAQRWQWHHQAITSMIQAGYWDDVDIRFPLAYRQHFEHQAQASQIPLHLLLAVSRQESSFEPTIVSPAGARGLMQLMPATARETARRHGVPYRGVSDLNDPGRNIQLGSRYYRQMLDRYGGNRILASAAYNAGPSRIDGWLRQSAGTLPFDAWIEVIPFAETRNYVQNVLAFSMIFAHHLGTTDAMLDGAERTRQL